MVQMRVGEDDGIQLVERKGFGGVEERHWVGVRGDVDAYIDHDSGFVGGHVVASPTDFTVGTQSRHSRPCATWTGRAVNVQTEILQQFATFIAVRLSVHSNVVNGF